MSSALATAACSDPRTVHWRFAFGDEADADRAGVVEGAIRKGGCDGAVVFSTATDGDSATEAPGTLGPGRYALTGVARDADCVRFAAGCTDEIDLPIDDGATLEVVLEHVADIADCGLGYCDDGVCGDCDDPQTEICNDQDDDCGGIADDTDAEEGDEPDAEVLRACPGFVVISEIAFQGPSVASNSADEFIELYNRRALPVNLSAGTLTGTGLERSQVLFTFASGARLPAFGYYLVASTYYENGVSGPAPDGTGATWSNRFVAVSGLASLAFTSTGAEDRVAWGGLAGGEGEAFGELQRRSLERKAQAGEDEGCGGNGLDTDDNAHDFEERTARDPQSSLSDPEPPCDL